MGKRHPSNRQRGSCAEAALSELCIDLGYCISPAAQEAILEEPPHDAEAFVNAVVVAEGLNPELMEKATRRELVAIVTDWVYDNGHGRGTLSGLPRFPKST